VWLTAAQMSALFGRELSGIRRHIRNLFAEKEVPDQEGYRTILPVIAATGGRPEPTCNLDVIISVGYRVKSQRGVEFRQWAKKALAKKGQATELFGTDRCGDGLASILGNLEQTRGGDRLYPNVETRAGHLLY